MKIRTGFVSNSSSSSFLIYGTEISRYDLIKLLIENYKEQIINKYKDEDFSFENFDGDFNEIINSYGLNEIADNIKIPLFYRYDYDSERVFFGRSLTEMADDETFGEFKSEIKEKLKSMFGENMEPSIIKEVYYC